MRHRASHAQISCTSATVDKHNKTSLLAADITRENFWRSKCLHLPQLELRSTPSQASRAVKLWKVDASLIKLLGCLNYRLHLVTLSFWRGCNGGTKEGHPDGSIYEVSPKCTRSPNCLYINGAQAQIFLRAWFVCQVPYLETHPERLRAVVCSDASKCYDGQLLMFVQKCCQSISLKLGCCIALEEKKWQWFNRQLMDNGLTGSWAISHVQLQQSHGIPPSWKRSRKLGWGMRNPKPHTEFCLPLGRPSCARRWTVSKRDCMHAGKTLMFGTSVHQLWLVVTVGTAKADTLLMLCTERQQGLLGESLSMFVDQLVDFGTPQFQSSPTFPILCLGLQSHITFSLATTWGAR